MRTHLNGQDRWLVNLVQVPLDPLQPEAAHSSVVSVVQRRDLAGEEEEEEGEEDCHRDNIEDTQLKMWKF